MKSIECILQLCRDIKTQHFSTLSVSNNVEGMKGGGGESNQSPPGEMFYVVFNRFHVYKVKPYLILTKDALFPKQYVIFTCITA